MIYRGTGSLSRLTSVLVVLTCITHAGYGGEEVAANATRPSVSDNAFMTAQGHAEIETGGSFAEDAWSIPTLLKLSVSDGIELGAAMTGIINYTTAGGTEAGVPGAQVKGRITSGEWGAMAAAGRIDWPKDSGPVYTAYPVVSLRSLPVAVDVTAGVFFSKGAEKYIGHFLYAVAVAPKLEGDVGVFVEVFGVESSESSSTGADAGVSYTITPRLVIDAAVSTKIAGDIDDWGIQAGFTWTIGRVIG